MLPLSLADTGQSVEMSHAAHGKDGQDGNRYWSECASITLCGQDGQSVRALHFVDRMVKVCEHYTLWTGWSKCASVTLCGQAGQSVQVLHFVGRIVEVCKCYTLWTGW